jgi:hypothetical protein
MAKHTPAVIEPERGALAKLEKDYIAEAIVGSKCEGQALR